MVSWVLWTPYEWKTCQPTSTSIMRWDRWCPWSIAKLVNIPLINKTCSKIYIYMSMVFMGYKPRNITGGGTWIGIPSTQWVGSRERNTGKPSENHVFFHELSGFLHILTSTNSGKHKRMFEINSESMCLTVKTWDLRYDQLRVQPLPWRIGVFTWIPSGERLHIAMERSTIFHGNYPLFRLGHFPLLFVCSPEGVWDLASKKEEHATGCIHGRSCLITMGATCGFTQSKDEFGRKTGIVAIQI